MYKKLCLLIALVCFVAGCGKDTSPKTRSTTQPATSPTIAAPRTPAETQAYSLAVGDDQLSAISYQVYESIAAGKTSKALLTEALQQAKLPVPTNVQKNCQADLGLVVTGSGNATKVTVSSRTRVAQTDLEDGSVVTNLDDC